MYNQPCHYHQENKPPFKYAVKKETVDWLQINNVQYSMEMKKFLLYELCEPQEKKNGVEETWATVHSVLGLPSYICHLNPIGLAQAKVKRVVKENNICGDLYLTGEWRRLQRSREFRKQILLGGLHKLFSENIMRERQCNGRCHQVRRSGQQ